MSYRKAFSAPLLALTLAAASLGLTGQAFAHAYLLSSTPAANDMAMPPSIELRLKFSEGLELEFTKVKLTGADNVVVKTGPAQLDPKDNTLLIVPLMAPLADGKYKVDWQAVSTDGHKTKGTYSFDSMQYLSVGESFRICFSPIEKSKFYTDRNVSEIGLYGASRTGIIYQVFNNCMCAKRFTKAG